MAAVATAANAGTLRRLMAPGWIRAAWMTLAGSALSFGLVVGLRALQGYEPLFSDDAIVTVLLLAAPLAFLVGIGGFDYWGRWMIGRPTQPEDHSDHGARSWKDYFRVNTDHKVIGIQYTVTALFFMLVGGGPASRSWTRTPTTACSRSTPR
jgi:cytochrome c oxidase subunit 1